MEYENLDLLFEPWGDAYRVRLTRSLRGEVATPKTFNDPISDRDLTALVASIDAVRGQPRFIDSPEFVAARTMGGELFSALFDDKEFNEKFRGSLLKCSEDGKGLRLRLNLTETPALLNRPWEFLHDGKDFLSLSEDTSTVRYLSIGEPVRSLPVELPLRILVMESIPSDRRRLKVEKEVENLRGAVEALEAEDQVVLDVIPATLSALRESLRVQKYHVFHFIGHGGFHEASRNGGLIFEDADGRAKGVSGEVIGHFLSQCETLQLVVLNACEGGRTDSKDPFAGVAQTLLNQNVPAVLAMQFVITDEAAICFSAEFYSSLVKGEPLDEALRLAREGIFADLHPTIEWATPVLYMRSETGILFDVGASAAPTEVVATHEPPVESSVVAEPPPTPVFPTPAEPTSDASAEMAEHTPPTRVPTAAPNEPKQELPESERERLYARARELESASKRAMLQARGSEFGQAAVDRAAALDEVEQLLRLAGEAQDGTGSAFLAATLDEIARTYPTRVSVAEEAVALRRKDLSDRSDPTLAAYLKTLASSLVAVQRVEEAVRVAEEAVAEARKAASESASGDSKYVLVACLVKLAETRLASGANRLLAVSAAEEAKSIAQAWESSTRPKRRYAPGSDNLLAQKASLLAGICLGRVRST